MIRIKQSMKNILKNMLSQLPSKYIVFESVPDLSDNTNAVYEEMLRRGLNNRYKFIWRCRSDHIDCPQIKNVRYISMHSRMLEYYLLRAKCVVCCNGFILSSNHESCNIYLGHANPLKNTKGYYEIPSQYDYIITTSECMKEINKQYYGLDEQKLIVLGYPRNDVLTQKRINLHTYFSCDYRKLIVWYPTYRQHKNGTIKTASDHALPIIWNIENAKELNKCAKENNVLIVMKPHFAQDISRIRNLHLSNIVFIDDSFFLEKHLTSYEFVGSSDALLTDYSSIYYDYTLCDKPIGLIWEDYKDYNRDPGFAVDMDYWMKGGEKIYNLEDLKGFIREISDGGDKLRDERREIRDFSNISTDGKNAERVVDFIISSAGL